MDFFDKLGKKATEAYKVTADKTGKIAKETKLRFKMNELKSEIEDIYVEIGKKVYEKHVEKEEISITTDLAEQCNQIDKMSKEIEKLLKECLDLKDKKQCQKCFSEIDKNMNFCPECGAKQEKDEKVIEVEIIDEASENSENKNVEKDENTESEDKTNLEKTTEIEINPDAQDISEEEMDKLGE